MPGYSPASNTSSNLSQATVTFYDKNFVENLKGETPVVRVSSKRELPLHSGDTIELFSYGTLAENTTPSTEGTVGSGVSASVVNRSGTVAIYSDYASISTLAKAAAIDPALVNIGKEMSYRLGQSLSTVARTVLDNAATVDPSVAVELAAAAGTPATYTPLSLAQIRSTAMSLQGKNVLPIENGNFLGVIHPFAWGDVAADNSTNSLVDILKHTETGLKQLDDFGQPDQQADYKLPSSGVNFFRSTLVTTTSNYKSSGLTALRTYILGNDGLITVSLGAKGDTPIGDGDWRNLKMGIEDNPPSSAADPAGLIGGWTYYRVHWTAMLPPGTTQRLRYIDAVSGIS